MSDRRRIDSRSTDSIVNDSTNSPGQKYVDSLKDDDTIDKNGLSKFVEISANIFLIFDGQSDRLYSIIKITIFLCYYLCISSYIGKFVLFLSISAIIVGIVAFLLLSEPRLT